MDFLRQVELMEIVAAAVAEGNEMDYSTAAADGKAAEPVEDTVKVEGRAGARRW